MKFAMSVLCAFVIAWPAHAGESQQKAASAAQAAQAQTQTQAVEIVGDSYSFKPDRIVVRANVPLELKVRRAPGMVPHNFVIDAARAGVQVKRKLGREPTVIQVTFRAPGEYAFFCSRKSPFGKTHRERGMEGVIVVTK